MRTIDEIRASRPSIRLADRYGIFAPEFRLAYLDATGRYPTALSRWVVRKVPTELIHIVYYVEFDTDDQMERFLSIWSPDNSTASYCHS